MIPVQISPDLIANLLRTLGYFRYHLGSKTHIVQMPEGSNDRSRCFMPVSEASVSQIAEVRIADCITGIIIPDRFSLGICITSVFQKVYRIIICTLGLGRFGGRKVLCHVIVCKLRICCKCICGSRHSYIDISRRSSMIFHRQNSIILKQSGNAAARFLCKRLIRRLGCLTLILSDRLPGHHCIQSNTVRNIFLPYRRRILFHHIGYCQRKCVKTCFCPQFCSLQIIILKSIFPPMHIYICSGFHRRFGPGKRSLGIIL